MGRKVDVLVAVTLPALAAQRATKTIPIVFLLVADPVASKLDDCSDERAAKAVTRTVPIVMASVANPVEEGLSSTRSRAMSPKATE